MPMAFSEECFSLTNKAGQTMHGIVHRSAAPNGALVVLFNIGLHYRTSHSRMFVRMARYLERAGFTVVRFDPSRVGYSQGEIVTERAIDMYDAVQTGLFREDSEATLKYLREQYQPTKIFLAGLCGGALTATIAAASDGQVDGAIFIAGPVTVTSAEIELSTMHVFEADQMLSMYARRAFTPTAWARFLTGKSDYRDLFRSIKAKTGDLLSRLKPRKETIQPPVEGEEGKGSILNRVFLAALDRLLVSGRHIMFVMPELDRATYDFDRLFLSSFNRRYADRKPQHRIVRIPKANHTFSSRESSQQLFEAIADWLHERVTAA